MEQFLTLHIEKLPEGVYLATSEALSGLVAQGRTVNETLEIAHDVARKLIEARRESGMTGHVLEMMSEQFDYPLVVGGVI